MIFSRGMWIHYGVYVVACSVEGDPVMNEPRLSLRSRRPGSERRDGSASRPLRKTHGP